MTTRSKQASSPVPDDLPERVIKYRVDWGLTQAQFAGLIGRTDKSVSMLELGRLRVSDELRAAIESVLAAPPASSKEGEADQSGSSTTAAAELIRSQAEIYRNIRSLRDGSKVFLVAASDVRDVLVPEREYDLLEALASKPNMTWTLVYPDKSAWEGAATKLGAIGDLVPSMAEGLERIREFPASLERRLKSPSFLARLSQPEARYKSVVTRVKSKAVITAHFFHPIVKLLLVIPPFDPAGPSPGRPYGWLEIPFYGANSLPVAIRLSLPEAEDLHDWLEVNEVDVAPNRL